MVNVELQDFNLKHIFECGQSFRWRKDASGAWIGIANERVLKIEEVDKMFRFHCTQEEYERYWYSYFDLGRDYGAIKTQLIKVSPDLQEAIDFGEGIRLLNQAPFEMLITFILSANNNIPRIASLIEKISKTYGRRIEHPWESEVGPLYSFPSAEALSNANQEDLRALGVGYRDKYIIESARRAASADNVLARLKELPYEEAKAELIAYAGVGEKVADCILLFSSEKHEAFPIDTWIKKTLARRYGLPENRPKDIKGFIEHRFGDLKGFAQQYLFYYEREHATTLDKF